MSRYDSRAKLQPQAKSQRQDEKASSGVESDFALLSLAANMYVAIVQWTGQLLLHEALGAKRLTAPGNRGLTE